MEERTPCMWVKCPRRVEDYPATKQCNVHALIVWQQVEASPAGQRHRDAQDVEKLQALKASRQEAHESRQARRYAEGGTIYFLRIGDLIKIGYADVLATRLKAYPPNTALLATRPGTPDDEYALHRRLKDSRSHGREWYHPTPEVMVRVDRAVAEYGPPPEVSFTALPAT